MVVMMSVCLGGPGQFVAAIPDADVVDQQLDIPQDLAHIADAHQPVPGALPDFILIQDVHRHAQVQGKIAQLIEYGYDHWGVRRVLMEGAFSKVDLGVFHRLPSETQEKLLGELVGQGKLSGPEWAAVRLMEREWRNPPRSPFQLLGMENPTLYLENLQLFRDVCRDRDPALRELASLQRLQDAMNLPQPNILDTQLRRAKDLLELKLTPADFVLYQSAREAIPESSALQPALREAEAFYGLVNQRSVAFLAEAKRKLPAGQGPRILVVGGFHTAFMAQQLRAQQASFVVLTPQITSGSNRDLYERDLLDRLDALQFAWKM